MRRWRVLATASSAFRSVTSSTKVPKEVCCQLLPCKGKGPRACHRLDFRVAGPVVVATSQEAMRGLARLDVFIV